MVLVALTFPTPFEDLITWNSAPLREELEARIDELFEGDLHRAARGGLRVIRSRLDARHSVMHNIWTLEDRDALFNIGVLQAVRSEEDLSELIRERGAAAKWNTLHPKANAPDPQTLDELSKIRIELEEAEEWLRDLSMTLASALQFVGRGGAAPGKPGA